MQEVNVEENVPPTAQKLTMNVQEDRPSDINQRDSSMGLGKSDNRNPTTILNVDPKMYQQK